MKKGILLVNLGTPTRPDEPAVKEFLSKFLSDKRVIKQSDFLWQPILHGIILRKRPAKVAKDYQKIWLENGSPLAVYTQAQKENLQKLLPETVVELAYSYSHPSISESLDKLLAQGVDDLTVIPLYPQYSGTTVGTVFDEVADYFHRSDKVVNLNFVASFYKNERYIKRFAKLIEQTVKEEKLDGVLFSFHNIPQSYVVAGDRYPQECEETVKLIMREIHEIPHHLSYQSIFGKEEWMKPQTDEIIKTLSLQNIKRLLVVAPGFVADCLETLLELEVENKSYFMENGGEEFVYLPAFNDEMEFAHILKDLI